MSQQAMSEVVVFEASRSENCYTLVISHVLLVAILYFGTHMLVIWNSHLSNSLIHRKIDSLEKRILTLEMIFRELQPVSSNDTPTMMKQLTCV